MKKVTTELPSIFLERLEKILTTQNFKGYLASLLHIKWTSFRTNTLKISSAELIKRLAKQNIYPLPIIWCPDGFYIDSNQRSNLTQTEEFNEGFLYIQNASSLFASLVLNPKPMEEVLDLCAAPGGKTLHMAALMKNQGRIAAVEAVKDRFFRLKTNIQRADATIIQPYHKDGMKIGHLVPKRFDRVLLDAPCSSEARFKLNDATSYAYWSEKKILEMSRKQKRLIYSALESLKPGGTLVYCTCSFAPEENEAIVQYALDKFGDRLEVLPIEVPFVNYQQGLSSWGNQQFSPVLSRAIRIIPNELMSGFFICKLRVVDNVFSARRDPEIHP